MRRAWWLEAGAAVLLAALAFRYHAGYIPRFFVALLPLAACLVLAAGAVALVQRTTRALFDFMLVAGTAGLAFAAGMVLSGFVPPAPASVYKYHVRADAQIYAGSLPGDLDLFLDGFDKSTLGSLDELGRRAAAYSGRWRDALVRQGFTPEEARAVGLMLFTSTLWAYGNAERPERTGCVTENEDNHWVHRAPTLEAVKSARIGCCMDFAHALALVLSGNGIPNRYGEIPGHVFNEALIDGRWQMLDATSNVFVNASWNEAIAAPAAAHIHVFPQPGALDGKLHRRMAVDFQGLVLDMLRLPFPPAPRARNEPGPDSGGPLAVERLY